jgi:hypothetical protein
MISIETIKDPCRSRYENSSNDEVKSFDVFTTKTPEEITVKIVFDREQSKVVTAYPIIQKA